MPPRVRTIATRSPGSICSSTNVQERVAHLDRAPERQAQVVDDEGDRAAHAIRPDPGRHWRRRRDGEHAAARGRGAGEARQGTATYLQCVISWRRPSSKISKSAAVRSVTWRPLLSVTTASTWTSASVTRITGGDRSCACPPAPTRDPASANDDPPLRSAQRASASGPCPARAPAIVPDTRGREPGRRGPHRPQPSLSPLSSISHPTRRLTTPLKSRSSPSDGRLYWKRAARHPAGPTTIGRWRVLLRPEPPRPRTTPRADGTRTAAVDRSRAPEAVRQQDYKDRPSAPTPPETGEAARPSCRAPPRRRRSRTRGPSG